MNFSSLCEAVLKLAPGFRSDQSLIDFEIKTKDKYRLQEFDLTYDSRTNSIHLNLIQVYRSDRGSGIGSQVMEELCDFADSRGMDIWLTLAQKSDEIGTTSRTRLIGFYKRFGFVQNKGRNKDYRHSVYCSMYRRARA